MKEIGLVNEALLLQHCSQWISSAVYWSMTWDCACAVISVFISSCAQLPSIVPVVHYKFHGSNGNWNVPKVVNVLHVIEALLLCLFPQLLKNVTAEHRSQE